MLPTKFWFIWPSSFKGDFFFRNLPIRNKNVLWRPCLLTERDEMSNLYRGPSIDASYQVSVHLAKRFQRRRSKCEKLTNDKRRTTDAKWWQKLTLSLARWAKIRCCNLFICLYNGSLSKYTHFFLFIFWWHQIFSFPFCFSLLVFPTLQWHSHMIWIFFSRYVAPPQTFQSVVLST